MRRLLSANGFILSHVGAGAAATSTPNVGGSFHRRLLFCLTAAVFGSEGRQNSRDTADAFLAGLCSRPTAAAAEAVAVPVAVTLRPQARTGETARTMGAASVEELLADDRDDGDDEDGGGEGTPTDTSSLLPRLLESVEWEAAFYDGAVPPPPPEAAVTEDDAILDERSTAAASAPLPPNVAAFGHDGGVEDVGEGEEEEEDEVFMLLDEATRSPLGDGSPEESSEGLEEVAAVDEVLGEALEAMALLEEEEEVVATAAASTALRSSTPLPSSFPSGDAEYTEGPSSVAFFSASADDIHAAKGSMDARTASGGGGSERDGGAKPSFDIDKTVASAEMESMGEELKSPAR